MYLDRSTTTLGGKTYHRILLRQSFRQEGKVCHQTIANLSKYCSEQEIAAIDWALKHKEQWHLAQSQPQEPLELRQGISCGAVCLLCEVAQRLGLVQALGKQRAGKLALWQVLARVIDQGSRLSAVRLAGSHAACEVLGLGRFDEDDLYENLAWLSQQQAGIEQQLFARSEASDTTARVFLYDVTSTYLEGQANAMAAFGYNRDGKRGKKQLVIGLLADEQGMPLSIEVFKGNTSDPKTFGPQIEKAARRFGAQQVVFVGDRGMIKGPQIQELRQEHFHYITAITKAQIRTLLQEQVLQLELFDEPLAEVEQSGEAVRYILRRNPQRAQEVRAQRQSKLVAAQQYAQALNEYLKGHPRAKEATAQRKLQAKVDQLKLKRWVSVVLTSRCLSLHIDEAALAAEQSLDGCYALKTDLSAEQCPKEQVHQRYKDLSRVEECFRRSKSVELEMRPVFVQCEKSTRGHALVVMLAYRLMLELGRLWHGQDLTVEEGIKQLSTLCLTEVLFEGQVKATQVPQPRQEVARLLELAQVTLPKSLPPRTVKVATKKKLTGRRPRRSK